MTAAVVSRWYRSARNDMVFEGTPTRAWYRAVDDGHLRAYVADDPSGWHVSISFVDETDRPTRLPDWDELWHARHALVPDNVTMAIVMPRLVEGGELGPPTLLHLHEIPWPPAVRR
jgi:hypothetical protein